MCQMCPHDAACGLEMEQMLAAHRRASFAGDNSPVLSDATVARLRASLAAPLPAGRPEKR